MQWKQLGAVCPKTTLFLSKTFSNINTLYSQKSPWTFTCKLSQHVHQRMVGAVCCSLIKVCRWSLARVSKKWLRPLECTETVAYESFQLIINCREFNWNLKRSLTLVAVYTRAGCLREWSQWELWLNCHSNDTDYSFLVRRGKARSDGSSWSQGQS